jgi:hypothetical protein
VTSALTEHIAGIRLVDNRVHGFWQTAGDRRQVLTEDRLARIFLPAAGVRDWPVDTSLPGAIAGPPEMADVSGGGVGEIVRLEQAAAAPDDYADAFRRILHQLVGQAGGKCIQRAMSAGPVQISGTPGTLTSHSSPAIRCCAVVPGVAQGRAF